MTNIYDKFLNPLHFNTHSLLNKKLIYYSLILLIFFTSVGSISDMVLIASHKSVLLLYCLPPSYNLIFTRNHRFLVGLKSDLHNGIIIISSVIFFMLKEFMSKLRYMRSSLFCIKTHFTLKLWNWDLYHKKKVLSIKLEL